MPRAKATDVVIHRIELGGKERELAEGALAAFQFNRVATPLVAGLSDVTFVLTLGALLKIYFPKIILPVEEDGMDAVLDAIYQGIANADPNPGRPTLGGAISDPDRNFFGELLYNLTNPNWAAGGPGFREAWEDAFG